jgi:hypothetical protein
VARPFYYVKKGAGKLLTVVSILPAAFLYTNDWRCVPSLSSTCSCRHRWKPCIILYIYFLWYLCTPTPPPLYKERLKSSTLRMYVDQAKVKWIKFTSELAILFSKSMLSWRKYYPSPATPSGSASAPIRSYHGKLLSTKTNSLIFNLYGAALFLLSLLYFLLI